MSIKFNIKSTFWKLRTLKILMLEENKIFSSEYLFASEQVENFRFRSWWKESRILLQRNMSQSIENKHYS